MTASDHSSESPNDRASLAREAGLGRLSFPSILAGVLVAYGAFAVLAALIGTVAAAIGLNTDLNQTTGPPSASAAPSPWPWCSWQPTCSAGTWLGAWPGGPGCSTA